MKINADLTKPAVVRSDALPWVPSPLPGVERRMLERDGDEVARVTSLVRYAPGSRFAAHTHSGGEEFLVLDGTFSDDYGDFPVGTYARNPVGSRHSPHSEDGTTILVKLWWMHAEDQDFVRIDTTREELWQATESPGVQAMPLHAFKDETTALYRLAPGAELAARNLPGGEEIFVLAGSLGGPLDGTPDGTLDDMEGEYGPGSWRRTPAGRAAALASTAGARLFVKRGHLWSPPPGPPALPD